MIFKERRRAGCCFQRGSVRVLEQRWAAPEKFRKALLHQRAAPTKEPNNNFFFSFTKGWENRQRKEGFFILRESDTFGEGRTTSRTILKTLSACIRRNGDTKRKSGSSRTKGNPGERSKIISWNVRGCSRTIERRISGTAASLKDKRRTSRTHPDLL